MRNGHDKRLLRAIAATIYPNLRSAERGHKKTEQRGAGGCGGGQQSISDARARSAAACVDEWCTLRKTVTKRHNQSIVACDSSLLVTCDCKKQKLVDDDRCDRGAKRKDNDNPESFHGDADISIVAPDGKSSLAMLPLN